jgi:DNA-binding winged helix-turn-helix (wHTH) protein
VLLQSLCLQKFEEILSLSKKCDYIISVGDFLDSPVVANTIVDDLLDRIDANKKEASLTRIEKDVIAYLIEKNINFPNKPIAVEDLIQNVWKKDGTTIYSVRNKIFSIRAKTFPSIIKNKSNNGYMIELEK